VRDDIPLCMVLDDGGQLGLPNWIFVRSHCFVVIG
jgi:hypothetical protein